ncbi:MULTISPECIES: DUF4229 domain-containing protein [Micromonospora]|uniref:DUF4229 domain-containing protein n=1 Tax=Micromonospora maris TaxID=1003110 RepID=A0A9X0I9D6_9ACTN|nr:MULTISPECIES: DUF4229 domain-containing protein [Micromonospora]KUJ49445.1 hypothetical protein ADL17_01480 [Micromonospora maris]RUL91150.1 DUF4229 domain-containing protein [Verrucosispora sp. FIM060022]
MSAAVKYTLGRVGLFAVVVAALWPVDIDIFLKLIVALLFSAALSFFLLKGWRDEMAEEMAAAAERRRTEKEQLRSALAGDDQAATGDAGTSTDQATGDAGSSTEQPGSSDSGRGPAA